MDMYLFPVYCSLTVDDSSLHAVLVSSIGQLIVTISGMAT